MLPTNDEKPYRAKNAAMFKEPRHYPRKELEEAAQYAIDLSNLFLQLFKIAGIPIKGARYLEIGPGPDFALNWSWRVMAPR
jgi:hypothetical protein